jgi:RNA polymerase sigma-70 factor (ECF subfamily)
MPEGYKMIFNLHVVEGYNHNEIAEMLQIAEGSSKSQLSKAKAYLKKLIEDRLISAA